MTGLYTHFEFVFSVERQKTLSLNYQFVLNLVALTADLIFKELFKSSEYMQYIGYNIVYIDFIASSLEMCYDQMEITIFLLVKP